MRTLFASILLYVVVACGGGGGGAEAPAGPQVPVAERGTRLTINIPSANTSDTYVTHVYVPPASTGDRAAMPVVYALDGQTWFGPLADLADTAQRGMIVVALDGIRRNIDYVPDNHCTPNGGGHAAFFEFIGKELIPLVERQYGGDPKKRVLFGHSHGGAFALYAMFSEAPGAHSFATYLASDASVSCMPEASSAWDQAYANVHRTLPVRLHLSYATLGNFAANRDYAGVIAARKYEGFTFVSRAYTGTHGGIVPEVLNDGTAFAF
ncbi:MAG: alpha/beta hydrolase-fold protein [Pseudomonadota bacterium]